MQQWADYLDGVCSGADVVHLFGQAAGRLTRNSDLHLGGRGRAFESLRARYQINGLCGRIAPIGDTERIRKQFS